MRILTRCVILMLAMIILAKVYAATPVITGNWIILDDQTNKPYALAELFIIKNQLNGRFIKLLCEKQQQICHHCPAPYNNSPLEGLVFMWNLQKLRHNKWGDGKILEPRSGKIYHVQVKYVRNKLYVRSYVWTTLLGKTHIWKRQ